MSDVCSSSKVRFYGRCRSQRNTRRDRQYNAEEQYGYKRGSASACVNVRSVSNWREFFYSFLYSVNERSTVAISPSRNDNTSDDDDYESDSHKDPNLGVRFGIKGSE